MIGSVAARWAEVITVCDEGGDGRLREGRGVEQW